MDHQRSKVMLTHKKSLLKSKYPLLTDFSQLRPNMELEGYIVAVKDSLVIVSFFNDIKVCLKKNSSDVKNNLWHFLVFNWLIKLNDHSHWAVRLLVLHYSEPVGFLTQCISFIAKLRRLPMRVHQNSHTL